MAARRRIDPAEGARAVRDWAAGVDRGDAPASPAERAARRRTMATAVRFTLEELAACAPGRAVEVRVPPFGVTQAVSGTVHRRGTPPSVVETERGTPPSVVETDGATWLALATGRLGWGRALADGALHASGERCDISSHLPLMRA